MPKLKIEEAGSLSKYERQKLKKLYTQGAAAHPWQKPADYQYQRLDNFYIQRLLVQNLFLVRGNTKNQENEGFC